MVSSLLIIESDLKKSHLNDNLALKIENLKNKADFIYFH